MTIEMTTHVELTPRLQREKALYLYTSALERGDFETVEMILEQAVHDADLERMICEIHEVIAEVGNDAWEQDAATVRGLVHEHLLSGVRVKAKDLPPLTVSDVCAKLQMETSVIGKESAEVASLTERLRQVSDPLPDELTRRGLRQLFAQLGTSVSEHVQELFREAAISLSMIREQGMTRMTATRRQPRRKKLNTTLANKRTGRKK
jgi:hypothetical protein